MQTRKVFLVRLPNGTINLIPLEEIVGCKIITPNENLGFWVYEKTIPAGASDGIGDEMIVRNLRGEDIETIFLKNGGICFVEVDWQNKLCMPSNGRGFRKVVIFLEDPKQASEIPTETEGGKIIANDSNVSQR